MEIAMLDTLDWSGFDRILKLPQEEAVKTPDEILYQAWWFLDQESKRIKQAKDSLQKIFSNKYQDIVNDKYSRKGERYGQVSWKTGNYKVYSKIYKKVKWNQEGLRSAYQEMKENEMHPEGVIDVKFHVTETKFNGSGEDIRKVLTPHRDVTAGAHTFSITVPEKK